MIGARRIADAEIGAQKRRAEFSYKLLHGVGLIAETLAELAIATMLSRCEVDQLMTERGIIAFRRRARRGADKSLARRQVDVVAGRAIEGAAFRRDG